MGPDNGGSTVVAWDVRVRGLTFLQPSNISVTYTHTHKGIIIIILHVLPSIRHYRAFSKWNDEISDHSSSSNTVSNSHVALHHICSGL